MTGGFCQPKGPGPFFPWWELNGTPEMEESAWTQTRKGLLNKVKVKGWGIFGVRNQQSEQAGKLHGNPCQLACILRPIDV